MRFAALGVLALLSVSVAPAATTFANINYASGSPLKWGSCTTEATECSGTVDFNYVGVDNKAPYNQTVTDATMEYYWTAAGPAVDFPLGGLGTFYEEPVEGYFSFYDGATNLLTVDFTGATADLEYVPGIGWSLVLNALTSTVAPTFTSDVVTFAQTLTDWSMRIDLDTTTTPSLQNGDIKAFNSSWSTFSVGVSPSAAGTVPEPASMLMAGVGLLSIGGLLSLRRRLRK